MSEWPKDYSDLGIERDTFACVGITNLRDAKKYAFDMLLSGAEVKVARDADDPKKYHVAVLGGMAGTPLAWIVNVRGEAFDPQVCYGAGHEGQHPLITKVSEEDL